MRNGKRFMSLLLAAVLFLGVMPGGVLASEEIAEALPEEGAAEADRAEEVPLPVELPEEAVEALPEETDEAVVEIEEAANAGVLASGVCGANLTWSLSDGGVMRISGTGAMTYYSDAYKIPWFSYTGLIKSVVVEDGVTALGRYVFRDCINLTEASLPDSLTSIGIYAFANCPNLLEVNLPESLVSIGQEAFSGCSSLTSITIPCPTGRWAFTNCTDLKTAIILDGSTFLEEGVFSGCTSLEEVSIPSSVTEIRKTVFSGCTSLEKIEIPNSVRGFGWGAFSRSGITGITIPVGVTWIASWMFNECQNLRIITLPESVSKIDERAFYACHNLSHVYYAGDRERWDAIEIIDTWNGNQPSYYGYKESFNQPIYNADLHCNSAGPEPFTRVIYSSGDTGIDRYFKFRENEEVEDLVLSTAATEYNPRLAHMLCVMARAAYDQPLVRSNLEEMGFFVENELISGTDYYEDYADDTTVAFSLAKKTLSDGSTFVMITIRGTTDWSVTGDGIRNADIGIAALNGLGKHEGFQIDAEKIYDALSAFLGGIPTSNVTYVITGHSQGAAAGNLLAVLLYDNGVPTSRVYDYNFACPNVACLLNPNDWNPGGVHDNIFNIGNVKDPVSFLPSNLVKVFIPRVSPLSTWGKFGRCYWFFPDSLNHSVAGHDMIYYDNELSQEKPLSSFSEYWQLSTEKLLRVLGIHCPVDVTVYDASGTPVAGVYGSEPNYYGSEFGEVMIFVDGDEKWICLPTDQEYDVRLSATDNGTMSYEVYDAYLSEEGIREEKTFVEVALTTDKAFFSYVDGSIDVPDVGLYVAGGNGGAAAAVGENGAETAIPHGDMTGDGQVDVIDLLRLLKYVNGQSIRLIASGDVTGDGIINTADLLRLLKFINGQDVTVY